MLARQFLFILFPVLFSVADYGRAREANQVFELGEFERAEQLYRLLLSEDPQNAQVLFNLGTALAQQGRSEEASELFLQYSMQATTPGQRAPGEYNLGYLQAQDGQTSQALHHFEQALRLDPADEDAKFNFELLLRRKQSEQEQEQDQQQSDGGGSSSEAQAMPAGGQPSDVEHGDQSTQPSADSQQSADTRTGSAEEALQHAEEILNVLEQIEKELIREYQRRQTDPVEPHEKDW